MAERWKPNNRKEYFYVNLSCADPKSDTWLNTDIDENRWENGNCFKTKEEAEYAAIKVKELLLSLHPEVATHQKLTAEVFDRPDCPEWAKVAMVNGYGFCLMMDGIPHGSPEDGYIAYGKKTEVMQTWGVFSLKDDNGKFYYVERPEKRVNWDEIEEILCNSTLTFKEIKQELPDWCKEGEWVWSDGDYYEVIETGAYWFRTSRNSYTGLWGANILPQFSQARLRPYNAEEMRVLVGKVIENDEYCYVVQSYDKNLCAVKMDIGWVYAWYLVKHGYTIDGNPCGVLEHLEDGEWVK